MEIALEEGKLEPEIPNNMSTMTQTEPRDPDEKYLEEVIEQTIKMTWEHFLECLLNGTRMMK